MKKVTSNIEFDFKHNGAITVHVGPEPIVIADEVADHLVSVFGERITMSEDTSVGTEQSGAVAAAADEQATTGEQTVSEETATDNAAGSENAAVEE